MDVATVVVQRLSPHSANKAKIAQLTQENEALKGGNRPTDDDSALNASNDVGNISTA
jgi:hypothetical protein